MFFTLLTLFLLPIANAEVEWEDAPSQCMTLEWDPAQSVEACRSSCEVDVHCEVYQFQQLRNGGHCWKGQADEKEHCWGPFRIGGRKIKTCDVVRDECCRFTTVYGLIPHQTWGRTPRNERGDWRFNNCDEVVGGNAMTNCPYTCSEPESAVEEAAQEAVVVPGSPGSHWMVNGFALLGLAFLTYGAGSFYCRKAKPEGDFTQL